MLLESGYYDTFALVIIDVDVTLMLLADFLMFSVYFVVKHGSQGGWGSSTLHRDT